MAKVLFFSVVLIASGLQASEQPRGGSPEMFFMSSILNKNFTELSRSDSEPGLTPSPVQETPTYWRNRRFLNCVWQMNNALRTTREDDVRIWKDLTAREIILDKYPICSVTGHEFDPVTFKNIA